MTSSTVSVVHVTQFLRRGGGGRNDVVRTTSVPHDLSDPTIYFYLYFKKELAS